MFKTNLALNGDLPLRQKCDVPRFDHSYFEVNWITIKVMLNTPGTYTCPSSHLIRMSFSLKPIEEKLFPPSKKS